jgi:hypothetical protein
MMRWLTERTIRVIFAFIMASGWLLYLDWKTNGNVIKAIIQTPLSAAIFGGLTFIGVVLLCIGG